jgi:uncharacterized protein YkwD
MPTAPISRKPFLTLSLKLISIFFILYSLFSILHSFSPILSSYFLLPSSNILGSSASLTAADITSFVNLVREQHGLNPLIFNQELSTAATAKAQAILNTQTFSHTPPGFEPWEFLDNTGYRYAKAGENLATNFFTSEQVVKGWLRSTTHRENLLNPEYTQTGVGIAFSSNPDDSTVIIVQYNALPQSAVTNQNELDPIRIATQMIDTSILKDNPLILSLSNALILIAAAAFILMLKYRHLKKKPLIPTVKHWKK